MLAEAAPGGIEQLADQHRENALGPVSGQGAHGHRLPGAIDGDRAGSCVASEKTARATAPCGPSTT